MLKTSYKQTRKDDDRNQPRSVQSWFSDSHRRRYWLVEGQEDSNFRVYRENDGKTSKTNTWFSVAGSIDEINALADKFAEEGTLNARQNADKLRSVIPRFEANEEKRRRREYRQLQKSRFTRPEPGFSLYEGRTRGKRAKYTFDDGEDVFDSDGLSARRSTRNGTPVDTGPVVTASGRQVKSRVGGMYGETLSTDQRKEHDYNEGFDPGEDEDSDDDMPATAPGGRPMRSARAQPDRRGSRTDYGDDDDMEESDEKQSEGEEWSGDENEPDDEESEGDESDGDVSGDELAADEGDMQKSLVVQLRYRPRRTPVPPSSRARTPMPSNEYSENQTGNAANVVASNGVQHPGSVPAITQHAAAIPASSPNQQAGHTEPLNVADGMRGIEVPLPQQVFLPTKPLPTPFSQPPAPSHSTVQPNGVLESTTTYPDSTSAATSSPPSTSPQSQSTDLQLNGNRNGNEHPSLPEMSTGIRSKDTVGAENPAVKQRQYHTQPPPLHVMDVS